MTEDQAPFEHTDRDVAMAHLLREIAELREQLTNTDMVRAAAPAPTTKKPWTTARGSESWGLIAAPFVAGGLAAIEQLAGLNLPNIVMVTLLVSVSAPLCCYILGRSWIKAEALRWGLPGEDT